MSTNKVIFPKLSEKTTCIIGVKLPVRSPEMQDYYTKSQTNKLIEDVKSYTDEEIEELEQKTNNKIGGIKIPTKLSELENDKGFITEGESGDIEIDLTDYYTKQDTDNLLKDKLSTSQLNNAIDDALAQAKESGEFKGDKGDKGDQGIQGISGKDGVNGQNGLNGLDGRDGRDGTDGKTPIKGVDYFTDAEKQELIANINAEVGGDIPIVVLPPDTVEIEPNKLYLWDTVESLTITLATPTDESIVNEYMIQFTSGDIATQLTLPDTITWMSEPTIVANATYQISIINNLAIIGEFINE